MKLVLKKDWGTWLDGMRSKIFKAGAESISTQLIAFGGSNGAANIGVDWLKNVGLNFKQFLALIVIQFTVRVLLAAAMYVEQKPDPDVIREVVDTESTKLDAATGAVVETATTKSVTTTPVPSTEPKP